MNPNLSNLLEKVNGFLAYYLDRLKIGSPITYTLVQILIWGLFTGFTTSYINIDEAVDTWAIVFLGSLVTLISPRTTVLKEQYEDRKITKGLKSEPEQEELQYLDNSEDTYPDFIELPFVDQSNS